MEKEYKITLEGEGQQSYLVHKYVFDMIDTIINMNDLRLGQMIDVLARYDNEEYWDERIKDDFPIECSKCEQQFIPTGDGETMCNACSEARASSPPKVLK